MLIVFLAEQINVDVRKSKGRDFQEIPWEEFSQLFHKLI
jgi:hypothetical protein